MNRYGKAIQQNKWRECKWWYLTEAFDSTGLSLQVSGIAIFIFPRVGHMLAPRDPT